MSERYVKALWDEIVTWQELDAVLHVQRTALINRDSDQVWECQERLREHLRQTIVACQETVRLKTPLQDPAGLEAERKAQAMRLQVRDAIRLNNELLRDICTYLEMIRDVALPHTLPPTYSNPRVVGTLQHRSAPSLRGTKVA